MRTQPIPNRLSVLVYLFLSFSFGAFAAGTKPEAAAPTVVDSLHHAYADSSIVRGNGVVSEVPEQAAKEANEPATENTLAEEEFVPERISWMYTREGIRLEHVPEGASLAVMNLHGRKVMTMDAADEAILLPLVEKGIFILQIHYGEKMVAYRLRN